MTAKKSKKVKLLICRKIYGSGVYEIAKNLPGTIEEYTTEGGFCMGYLEGFCAEEFSKIFPHLKLRKGQGPFLIEVSAKLLKMPKKKAKK